MGRRSSASEPRIGSDHWLRCPYLAADHYLRPAPDAEPEFYDPWQADREAASEEERPYKVLLRLVQQIGLIRGEVLGTRHRKRLEAWLAANGPLGLLPHETLEYRTAARWYPHMVEGAKEGELFAPTQRHVRRTAGGWKTTLKQVGNATPVEAIEPYGLVDRTLLNRFAEGPYATYRSSADGTIASDSLRARFEPYFPHLGPYEASVCDYPLFSEVEFWRSYSEPLYSFLWAVFSLANPLAGFLQEWEGEEWRVRNAFLALGQINEHAFGCTPIGRLAPANQIELRWSFPSLLAIYAGFILRDLAAGQRVLRCPVCESLFLSGSYQAKFCSSTCRSAHHKRQQRAAETP